MQSVASKRVAEECSEIVREYSKLRTQKNPYFSGRVYKAPETERVVDPSLIAFLPDGFAPQKVFKSKQGEEAGPVAKGIRASNALNEFFETIETLGSEEKCSKEVYQAISRLYEMMED